MAFCSEKLKEQMTKQEGLRVTLILNCIQKISGYNNIKMKSSLFFSSGAKFKTTNIWSLSCVRHCAWITILRGGHSPWP